MSDATTRATAVEQARAAFAREQLPFPPLPEVLAARMRADGEHIFSTIDHQFGPYTLEAHLGPALTVAVPEDYAIIGFDGHGINSWAVHYYLAEPGLALFIQIAWGGAYTKPDEERPRIAQAFATAARLQETVARAREAGRLPPGWRLVVVVTDFGRPGWAWVPSPPPGVDNVEWHRGGDPLAQALQAVTGVADGTTGLA
jgi:hypothetical protein